MNELFAIRQETGETAMIEVAVPESARVSWEELKECGWFFGPSARQQAEVFIVKLQDGTAFSGREDDARDFRVITW